MHAQAGTIGYELIHDEEARQAAKQASRERAFSPTVSGGISTPSTAASPHDAEAAREQERLKAAEHLKFLALVREWADGADIRVPCPAGAVQKVIDDLTHEARHADGAREQAFGPLTANFHLGRAHAYRDAVKRLTEALSR